MTKRIVAALALVGIAGLLVLAAGCAPPTGPAGKSANQKTEQKTQSTETSIDAAIGRAQSVVNSAAAVVGTAAARGKAQQINGGLQRLQSELKQAAQATGSAKTEAVNKVSAAFADVITQVDDAAKAAPAGSARQTALYNVAAKLRSAQATLAAAVQGSP